MRLGTCTSKSLFFWGGEIQTPLELRTIVINLANPLRS